MSDNKKIIQNQLAKSVLEKGSVKCPSCSSLVQWEDAEQYNPDGSRDRYFWCSNEECELHQKDVVKVSISKGFLQTFQQNFSKIGQGFIAAAFGALSVWGYSYFNPPEDNSGKLKQEIELLKEEKENQSGENDTLTKQIDDLRTQIKALADGTGTIPPPSDNSAVIDSLKKVISEKEAKINNLQVQSGNGQLSAEQMADLGRFYASPKNLKSKQAKTYLFKALNHPSASFDDKEYQDMVESLISLRMKLDKEDFEPLLKEIDEHLADNIEDVEKAKVYWFYADKQESNKDYKKYKQISLRHYLQGASRYFISQQDKDDAMKIVTMYGLEKIDPAKYNSDISIDIALSTQTRNVIDDFLDYGLKGDPDLFDK